MTDTSSQGSHSTVFDDLTMSEFCSISQLSGNNKCVDCGTDRPDWASIGFGTLVCLECAGFHRSIGVHISLVRSLKMDTWCDLHKNRLLKSGNKRFINYLSSRGITGDDASGFTKYTRPQVLYYREILQAELDGRAPVAYNESHWLKLGRSIKVTHAPTNTEEEIETKMPKWIPDAETTLCMICSTQFTVFFRRHHCRRCGKCVCRNCAPNGNTRPIMEWGLNSPVRHCRDCYKSPVIDWK